MIGKRPVVWSVCFLLIALFCLSGCGLMWWRKDVSFTSDLKKKVAVLPFEDSTGLGEENIDLKIANMVAKSLEDETDVILVSWDEVEAYMREQMVPTPLTQDTAAMVGRGMHLNAIVLGSIAEVSQTLKKTGWLRWFPFWIKRKDLIQAVLVARVVDVENGVVITADTGEGEVKTGLDEDDMLLGSPSGGPEKEFIDESLQMSVESLAENVADALDRSAWKGFLVKVEKERAVMSGGRDVGVGRGDRFVVYEVGEKITNAIGRTYVIPGEVKAQLVAESVDEATTVLKIVSGQVHITDSVQHIQ